MKMGALLAILIAVLAPGTALAKVNSIAITQRIAETQLRNLVEPVLNRFCKDECRLLSATATVDVATQENVAPGFDELDSKHASSLAPTSAQVRILINQKVGPSSRKKLLDLLQQYADTLDYPVRIDLQVTKFPDPIESSSKMAELRDRFAKRFKTTLDDLFAQFCPEQCMLADFTLSTEQVNSEEVQYGASGEYLQEGDVAIRIKEITGTLLLDEALSQDERGNILEMAKLKTNFFKNVSLASKPLRFPHPLTAAERAGGGNGGGGRSRSLASDSKSSLASTSSNSSTSNAASDFRNNSTSRNNNTSSDNSTKQERFERIEKIERVESGDAVQAELQKFKVFGLLFACSILSLLIFLAMASYHPKKDSGGPSTVTRFIQAVASDPTSTNAPSTYKDGTPVTLKGDDRSSLVAKRYEIERLMEELTSVFAQQPKVAKQVFSRILTEEGVEVTAQYIHLFGESIVLDMLRDPSLQADLAELMEFYAKNPIELNDDEKLELLQRCHNRTVAGKLIVLGNRSSNLFDFLAEMDGMQILELIRNESLTVKSIVLTQVDPQKRAAIYAQLDEALRMQLLTELSRIDYLPRDYIFNVANALKRKRRDNPRLNTEALPGSEVLVTLLERTGTEMQRTVVKSLEVSNPESARTIKGKLVSLDTLRYLRDGQLLEVVLSLRHDELLQFLKGAPAEIRNAIFAKSPKELIAELEEELTQVSVLSREAYQAVERKVLNRMKMMANDGLINLIEVNERMFADSGTEPGFVQTGPPGAPGANGESKTAANIKKVAGW